MFFRPVTLVLDKLRFPGKFSLIFLLILIPAIAVTVNSFINMSIKTGTIEKQHLGIEYLTKTQPLLKFIPQHRGLSQGFLKGKPELKGKLEGLQQKINTAMQELEVFDRTFTESLAITSPMGNIFSEWKDIQSKAFNYKPAQSFKEHTALITRIMQIQESVADLTTLLKSEDDSVYLLTRIAVDVVPVFTENMGQARGRGTGVAAAKKFTPQLFTAISSNRDNIEANGKRFSRFWQQFADHGSELVGTLSA